MKFAKYDFKEVEPNVERYWAHQKINEKTREKNKKGKKFYFLDGPPYTSGRIHLAHAWNYALKDMAVRYRKMKGDNVWDRNGFDMHGLPTELKVAGKHGLKTKEEIAQFGIDKFVKECQEFSQKMAQLMVKDLLRLGISLNFDNSYLPITQEFMEGEWWLIKKADEQERLYYGEKVLTWCAHCETALAKHECEYEEVKEDSVFVKFPVRGRKKEFLIIWTTTPWTLPFNLAVMVNPKLDYVRAKVDDEVWIIAKALAGPVVQSVADKGELRIMEEFKGAELEGTEYEQPWEKEIPVLKELKKKHKNIFTVILNEEYVDTSSGSGLVHTAPGCGPEDQEACKPYHIPPFNCLTEDGSFPKEMGKFAGLKAKVNDQKFIDDLKKKGNLIAVTPVEHEYPHCWRCHQPVIFRITYQWFIRIEDLKEKILEDNSKVRWVPESANNSFKSWVDGLRDNSVSRQRFWGTPLPIWKCSNPQCKEVDVFSSLEELKKKSGSVPKEMHLPWIDKVEYKCGCGGVRKRVPDVIDVWIDSGTASWNSLDNQPKLIKEWFPANFILEAKEQTRLWFSMLSICSQIAFGRNCYKNVYAHGMLNDLEGKKMSKSLGNIVSPYELIDKYGADVLRYYMCQNNAGQEINFSWDECGVKARQLHILWNIHKFLIDLSQENETNPFELDKNLMENLFDFEEKYIFSKLNRTIKEVTSLLEEYRLDEAIEPIEGLFLELSRQYIQMIREKSSVGSKAEKDVCLYTISRVLLETMKLFAPVAPFITEAIYLNLREEFGLAEESIHHFKWPGFNEKKIDLELEEEMEMVRLIIQSALNGREKIGLGLRWPLKELVVVSKDKRILKSVEKLKEIIEKQIKVKSVEFREELTGIEVKAKADYKKINPKYKELSPAVIAKLAMDSPETILGHLEKEGAYKFKVEGKEIEIVKEDLLIERSVPEPYWEGKFRGGFVYLNQERTDDLEGEGYARELMRIVQQMRKEAGLEKKDRIVLSVKVDQELSEMISKFKHDIKERVGAEKIEIGSGGPAKKHRFSGVKKVKKEKIGIWFDKV